MLFTHIPTAIARLACIKGLVIYCVFICHVLKYVFNYDSGEYEYIERDGFSIDLGEYVYNWDDSEYRREEEEEEERCREERRMWEDD